MQEFLPVNKKEMTERGWEQADFVYVTGDAYVDHPSFGHAIISRMLEGQRVYSGNHCPAGLEETRKQCDCSWTNPGLAFW